MTSVVYHGRKATNQTIIDLKTVIFTASCCKMHGHIKIDVYCEDEVSDLLSDIHVYGQT